MDPNLDTDSIRRQLADEGFAIVPDVIDAGALKKLHDRVALFYRAWDQYPASTRKELSGSGMNDYEPVREINWPYAAHQLLDHEPAVAAVRGLVDALAGGRCELIHVNSLLKPANRGAPVAPHQDTAYNILKLNQPLTAWIPFEEVTEAGGALYYLPGSHQLGDLRHESANRVHWLSESAVKELGRAAVRYSGAPGSIGIHDSRIVHGSYPNRSPRDRLALSLRFDRATTKSRA